MVHPRPQTAQGESVAKPESLLSLVRKYYIKELHDKLSNVGGIIIC